MATNKTIQQLTNLPNPNGADLFPIWDSGCNTTKNVSIAQLQCNTFASVEVLGSGANSTYRTGVGNASMGAFSASLGGQSNCASANHSSILGGLCNNASGIFS